MGKVAVLIEDGKAHTYEGNYEIGFAGTGCLIINEVVPDVTGKSETGTKLNPVTMYNGNAWTQVMFGD